MASPVLQRIAIAKKYFNINMVKSTMNGRLLVVHSSREIASAVIITVSP